MHVLGFDPPQETAVLIIAIPSASNRSSEGSGQCSACSGAET
jgi:hypothetical protein